MGDAGRGEEAGAGEIFVDGARGAAGSEHDEAFAGGVDYFPQAFQETFAVGVFADVLAVAADDAIDRADHLGRFAKAVKVLNDGDFVRDGAVETGPVHGSCAGDGGCKIFRGDLGVEIAIVHIVVAVGGLDHFHGRIFSGRLREGATATDLVLTVTEMLRKKGVVGKFVEFFGPGLAKLPIADRATIATAFCRTAPAAPAVLTREG